MANVFFRQNKMDVADSLYTKVRIQYCSLSKKKNLRYVHGIILRGRKRVRNRQERK